VSVSNGVELLSSGSRTLERLQSLLVLLPDGAPSLPYYRSRERLGYIGERKRERRKKKKEKKQGRRGPWSHVALLPR
jgi:hypothetical protein